MKKVIKMFVSFIIALLFIMLLGLFAFAIHGELGSMAKYITGAIAGIGIISISTWLVYTIINDK